MLVDGGRNELRLPFQHTIVAEVRAHKAFLFQEPICVQCFMCFILLPFTILVIWVAVGNSARSSCDSSSNDMVHECRDNAHAVLRTCTAVQLDWLSLITKPWLTSAAPMTSRMFALADFVRRTFLPCPMLRGLVLPAFGFTVGAVLYCLPAMAEGKGKYSEVIQMLFVRVLLWEDMPGRQP